MLRLVLPLLVTAMLSGCGKFIYGVDVLNYGQSGVLILQMGNEKSTGLHPAFVKLGVMVPIIRGFIPPFPPNTAILRRASGISSATHTPCPKKWN